MKKQNKTFSYENEDASEVLLAGDFTQWAEGALPMKRGENGDWKTQVSLPAGSHEYRFIVDGEWRDDPSCDASALNPYGEPNSICQVGQ